MAFRVGQKVVCVDADCFKWCLPLTRDAIYTIRSVEWDDVDRASGVLLMEVVNGMHPRGEFGYRPDRFRPLVEQKTDIGFAREILRKASRTRETVDHG